MRRCTSRRSSLRAGLGAGRLWLRLLVTSMRTKPRNTRIAPTAMSTLIDNNISPSPHRCASLVVHIGSFRLSKLIATIFDVKPVSPALCSVCSKHYHIFSWQSRNVSAISLPVWKRFFTSLCKALLTICATHDGSPARTLRTSRCFLLAML